MNNNYILTDNTFGPQITWADSTFAGAALDEFEGKRQVLIYDDDDDYEEPVAIIKYDNFNKVIEIQVYKEVVVNKFLN
jgi:hypothetical protein